MGWVTLRHKDFGGTTRVQDSEDVLAWHEARGWSVTDDEPNEPVSSASSAGEWVRMVHPETGGVQQVPGDPSVIAAQAELGWAVDIGPMLAEGPMGFEAQVSGQEPTAVGDEGEN